LSSASSVWSLSFFSWSSCCSTFSASFSWTAILCCREKYVIQAADVCCFVVSDACPGPSRRSCSSRMIFEASANSCACRWFSSLSLAVSCWLALSFSLVVLSALAVCVPVRFSVFSSSRTWVSSAWSSFSFRCRDWFASASPHRASSSFSFSSCALCRAFCPSLIRSWISAIRCGRVFSESWGSESEGSESSCASARRMVSSSSRSQSASVDCPGAVWARS
jgi:hypothetical protein